MRSALAEFDEKVRREGFRLLCGVDEAGRGPLAGPVVAAAVIFADCAVPDGLNDSKKLTQKKRGELRAALFSCGAMIGIGIATAQEIDSTDILSATFSAMRRAVAGLARQPDFILVDGSLKVRGLDTPQRPVVKGDSRSVSIAAASIVAKERRDEIMFELAADFPGYGFEDHAGYGTAAHLEAIAKLGPSPAHRKTFRGVREHLPGARRNGVLF